MTRGLTPVSELPLIPQMAQNIYDVASSLPSALGAYPLGGDDHRDDRRAGPSRSRSGFGDARTTAGLYTISTTAAHALTRPAARERLFQGAYDTARAVCGSVGSRAADYVASHRRLTNVRVAAAPRRRDWLSFIFYHTGGRSSRLRSRECSFTGSITLSRGQPGVRSRRLGDHRRSARRDPRRHHARPDAHDLQRGQTPCAT